jgi:hypothetical protein
MPCYNCDKYYCDGDCYKSREIEGRLTTVEDNKEKDLKKLCPKCKVIRDYPSLHDVDVCLECISKEEALKSLEDIEISGEKIYECKKCQKKYIKISDRLLYTDIQSSCVYTEICQKCIKYCVLCLKLKDTSNSYCSKCSKGMCESVN